MNQAGQSFDGMAINFSISVSIRAGCAPDGDHVRRHRQQLFNFSFGERAGQGQANPSTLACAAQFPNGIERAPIEQRTSILPPRIQQQDRTADGQSETTDFGRRWRPGSLIVRVGDSHEATGRQCMHGKEVGQQVSPASPTPTAREAHLDQTIETWNQRLIEELAEGHAHWPPALNRFDNLRDDGIISSSQSAAVGFLDVDQVRAAGQRAFRLRRGSYTDQQLRHARHRMRPRRKVYR